MARLARKLDGLREAAPAPVVRGQGGADVGIIAYGSSDPAVRESTAQLAAERGVEADYLRVRAWPFAAAVHDFVASHRRVYVVEQNRDAQLAALLKLDLSPELLPRLRPVAHIDGLPLDARSVTDEILTLEAR
jgi:2-oxoglutarate ferredoxin oxidoreductase subunit alpha